MLLCHIRVNRSFPNSIIHTSLSFFGLWFYLWKMTSPPRRYSVLKKSFFKIPKTKRFFFLMSMKLYRWSCIWRWSIGRIFLKCQKISGLVNQQYYSSRYSWIVVVWQSFICQIILWISPCFHSILTFFSLLIYLLSKNYSVTSSFKPS